MSAAKRSLRLVFGIALLVSLAWAVDPRQMLASLAQARLAELAAAAGLVAAATLVGAAGIHLFFEPEDQLPFRAFLPVYWLSWAIGLVFPGQVGDMASLSALLRRRGIDLPRSLARSLADKFISFGLMLACACTALAALPGVSWYAGRWWLLALPLALLSGVYAARAPLYAGLSRRFPRAVEFFARTLEEIRSLARLRPGRIMLNALLTVLKIGLTGTSYWFVFAALGYGEISLWMVVGLAAASSLVAYLPISFNGIGTVELAGVALFGALGVPAAVVFSGYLALRALVLMVAWVPAGMVLLLARKQAG